MIEGAFRVGLPEACTDAVKKNPNLWVRVTVDDIYSLPYTRLGAVPYAVESAHAVDARYAQVAENGVPAGTIIAFGGRTESLSGWLPCDGRAVARTDYPTLLANIGISWGDGSTTTLAGGPKSANQHFNLPDLRGVFVRGLDRGRNLDPGRQPSNTAQLDAFQGHAHNFRAWSWGINTSPSDRSWMNYTYGPEVSRDDMVRQPVSDGQHGTPRVATETRPINVALEYIIKY